MNEESKFIAVLILGVFALAAALTISWMMYSSAMGEKNKEIERLERLGTYVQGSNDCERRMQNEAVAIGAAHWEGCNDQYFVWNGLDQRFPRIR